MLLAFAVFLGLALVFSALEIRFGKFVWVAALILAIAFSSFLAYSSVSSVWVPNQMSDPVFNEEKEGELGQVGIVYRGTLPSSQLSFPFSLGVHHGHADEWFENNYGYGQVVFTMFFLNLDVFQINGTYSYLLAVGPTPLSYRMNFIFSDPTDFFNFLVSVFALINTIGALFGILVGRMIIWKSFFGHRLHLKHRAPAAIMGKCISSASNSECAGSPSNVRWSP
jgi:hypothetical protein